MRINSIDPEEDVQVCDAQLVLGGSIGGKSSRKPLSWLENPATHTMLLTPNAQYVMEDYAKLMEEIHRICKHLRLTMKRVKATTPWNVEVYLHLWSFSSHISQWMSQGSPRSFVGVCAIPRNILPPFQVPRTSTVEAVVPKHAKR